jgi:hypothetical protein
MTRLRASASTLSAQFAGPLPHEMYGKFTWRIEDFSEISKRELRSNVFEVGSYKWCECECCVVCNSIGLCGLQLTA